MTLKPLGRALMLVAALALAGCSSRELPDAPSPYADETVVVIHGLARSASAMRTLADGLEQAGYQVRVLDYNSLGKTPEQVHQQVRTQLNGCCDDAARVHFVGHSLGGLLTRWYFTQPDSADIAERLGQVVMIGTPNHGSALVDHYGERWWVQSLGDTALALGSDGMVTELPEPPFAAGIIAGTDRPALLGWLSDPVLGPDNDGLVATESTQLTNMADYLEVARHHNRLRDDPLVIEQTLHFLQQGRFNHQQDAD
ncbi:alpha/beta fold hydrolase [Ferrimonas balearica]|uniref:alpha/beta fold hydrolase n=1 Tax=Ferrimonas balearica TaxID=44012 RepID=UPI001C9A07E7|nr:alpha/beta fold hydrolase [Ferrimonas balearica]MBY5991504.1 alpha/beta hydrolase [Ferrimonas balearica]